MLAKCETRQALFEFQDIAQQADGIILSRGNLGLDVLPEKMALIQKAIISNCNLMGKPVMITRVVDTMITAPRPTRLAATHSCGFPDCSPSKPTSLVPRGKGSLSLTTAPCLHWFWVLHMQAITLAASSLVLR